MLPVNLDAERSLLGALIIDPEAIDRVADLVRPDDLSLDAHRRIYSGILELARQKRPADFVNLTDYLAKRGDLDRVGGPAEVAELTGAVPTAANVVSYAEMVADGGLRRRVAQEVEQWHQAWQNGQVPEVNAYLGEMSAGLQKLALGDRRQGEAEPLGAYLQETLDLLARYETMNGVTGLPTGFADFDNLTCGLQPENLIILAASTGQGKTALALNIALNAAQLRNAVVAFFSLEMSRMELNTRALCATGGANYTNVRRGIVGDLGRLTDAARQLYPARIFIDDSAAPTGAEIARRCRRLKLRQERLDLIVVDYLQLVKPERGGNQSREQQVSAISRALKELAREAKCPVLVLSQLSRAHHDRQDKRPQLHDLRESGAIEQDADMVVMLYCEKPEESDCVEVLVRKQRMGPTGMFRLSFQRHFTRFTDWR